AARAARRYLRAVAAGVREARCAADDAVLHVPEFEADARDLRRAATASGHVHVTRAARAHRRVRLLDVHDVAVPSDELALHVNAVEAEAPGHYVLGQRDGERRHPDEGLRRAPDSDGVSGRHGHVVVNLIAREVESVHHGRLAYHNPYLAGRERPDD